MPLPASVTWSAFSDEKQMPFSLWPSSVRSLSLAVMTATLAPASANAASSVPARRYFASFIITSAPASAVPEIVAADAVHGRRRAGHDRQVVRVGERRHDAVGGAGRCRVRRATARKGARPAAMACVDVVGLAAVDADDDQRTVRPAVGAAVDGDGAAGGMSSSPPRARGGLGAAAAASMRRGASARGCAITWS